MTQKKKKLISIKLRLVWNEFSDVCNYNLTIDLNVQFNLKTDSTNIENEFLHQLKYQDQFKNLKTLKRMKKRENS